MSRSRSIIDGDQVGTVTVLSLKAGAIADRALPQGKRIVVLRARYSADVPLRYRAGDWLVVDEAGNRYRSLGVTAPNRPLGAGRLAGGRSITGTVAFEMDKGLAVDSVVLTERGGDDLLDRGAPRPALMPAPAHLDARRPSQRGS